MCIIFNNDTVIIYSFVVQSPLNSSEWLAIHRMTNCSGVNLLQYNRIGSFLCSVCIHFNIGVPVLGKNKILWSVVVVACRNIYADTLVAFLTQTQTTVHVYSTFLLFS